MALYALVPVFDETGFPCKMDWHIYRHTHDLKETQESLRRSQRLEVVGQLTGGIAHDFNNILQVIVVNVENLGDADLLTPDIKKTIESIGRAVDRAGDLIRRLMTFLTPAIFGAGGHGRKRLDLQYQQVVANGFGRSG